MQRRELKRVEKSLESFLAGLTASMGRSERRHWAGVYVRGLLLDGERKSIEPMAMRLGASDQALQPFVHQSPWSADVLLEGLARATARSPSDYWIIDETSFPKAGAYSAGVQRQDGGALGKKANCQIAVSPHRANEQNGTSQPLSWRLYLPESWTPGDPARRQQAGVPSPVVHQSKLELALGLRSTGRGTGRCPPGWCSPTRRTAAASSGARRGAPAASATPCACLGRTTGWVEEPRFGVPATPLRGRPAHRHSLLSPEPKNLLTIAQVLPASAWKRVMWHRGSKGVQHGRLATFPLWAANGWRQGAHPERVEEVALVEWPAGEPAPTRYWLAQLERAPSLGRLVATARARWRVEQDYRELKDELGLDHFEGRSWQGFHHHVALVTTAFVFLRQEQARHHRRAQKKPAPAHAAARAPAQGYSGAQPAAAAEAHGIKLEVIKLAEAKRGFVLLPRRWVVERSFAWLARFRRLSHDYERLPMTLAGLHWLAFSCLLLSNLFKTLALSS